ncbi:MAG: calcium/sodium antiporter [DPANN group archaeon]|nr:calcium/sodium antiporter [DPANN group archaeon]
MLLYVQIIILIISIAILVVSSSKLIDSATRFASAVGLSGTVIGLTLIAYGTSLPELVVSSVASFNNYSAVAMGDIVGSNIFNITIIMGLAAIISPLFVKRWKIIKRDSIIMILSVIFLYLIMLTGGINRLTGIIMVLALVLYTLYTIKYDIENNHVEKNNEISKTKEVTIIIITLFFVFISSKMLLNSTINIAQMLSISEWTISAIIIAAGTGMPEIAVSIAAAKKGKFGIAIGNIIGTNIFNIIGVLGIAAIINPLVIDFQSIRIDLIFLFIISMFFMIGLWKKNITRSEGVLYILMYFIYILYLLQNLLYIV